MCIFFFFFFFSRGHSEVWWRGRKPFSFLLWRNSRSFSLPFLDWLELPTELDNNILDDPSTFLENVDFQEQDGEDLLYSDRWGAGRKPGLWLKYFVKQKLPLLTTRQVNTYMGEAPIGWCFWTSRRKQNLQGILGSLRALLQEAKDRKLSDEQFSTQRLVSTCPEYLCLVSNATV